MGPAHQGRPRRRRADQARARGARGDRGRALRRLRLRGRVGERPAQVLPQQRRRHAQPAGRDARRGRTRHRVLVDVRHLRRAGAGADRRAITRRARSTPTARPSSRSSARCTGTSAPTALRFAALRYFNAAGADPDGEIGEDHDPGDAPHPARHRGGAGRTSPSRSSAPTMRRPTERRSATTSTSKIWPTRTSRALDKLRDGATNLFVNLGTGRGHTVRQVIAAVETVSGKKVPARESGRRAGDPPALVADPRLAAEVLGWKARLPSIETIVEHAWRWRTLRAVDRRGAK